MQRTKTIRQVFVVSVLFFLFWPSEMMQGTSEITQQMSYDDRKRTFGHMRTEKIQIWTVCARKQTGS